MSVQNTYKAANNEKNKRVVTILIFAISAVIIAILLYTLISTLMKNAAESKRNTAATEIVLKSGFLDFEENKEGRLFSPIQEPWIAVRRDVGDDAEWRVIAYSASEELTEDDLKDIRTLIICEGYTEFTEQYVHYVNGARQGNFSVSSEGVNIRCIDLQTGCEYGAGEQMKGKRLPNSNPKENDRRYSDADVAKTVRQIASSQFCVGYSAKAWSYDPEGETLAVADADLMREHRFYPVPESAASLRNLKDLKNIKVLYIPPSVSFIADGALDSLWFVIVDTDSYALRYAMEHGIAYMENGTNIICSPPSKEAWSDPFPLTTNALKATWEETGAKAFYISPETKIDSRFFWTGDSGLQVLVDRDSQAELFFLEELGSYRSCCSYTYREAWLGKSTGSTPDRGEIVCLGRYEQDGNRSNGPEPVEWIVLDNDGETALLVSRYELNWLNERDDGVRLWMYDEFAAVAFTDEELNVIVGATLQEKVFLPDKRDIQGYLPSAEARTASLTLAARAEGGSLSWLLSGGERGFGPICWKGEIDRRAYQADCAVRPAIRIRTEAFNSLAPQNVPFEPKDFEIVHFGKNTANTRLYIDEETGQRISRFRTEDEIDEPIEWMVLDERDGMKLLLSNAYCSNRDDMARKENNKYRVQWSGSDLEQWLNSSFLKESFSPEEQAAIRPVVIQDKAEDGCSTYTEETEMTEDRVFLLSIEELMHYLPNAQDRIWYQSEWWLRSKTSESMCAVVWKDGHLASNSGTRSNATPRAAIWVDASWFDQDDKQDDY